MWTFEELDVNFSDLSLTLAPLGEPQVPQGKLYPGFRITDLRTLHNPASAPLGPILPEVCTLLATWMSRAFPEDVRGKSGF